MIDNQEFEQELLAWEAKIAEIDDCRKAIIDKLNSVGQTIDKDTRLHEIQMSYLGRMYTVTFDPNSGTSSVKTLKVPENKVIGSFPVAMKESSRFNGWFTQTTGGTQYKVTDIVNRDLTAYAQFKTIYTITFNTDGGTPVDPVYVEAGTKIGTLPTTTKDGYYFLGWVDDQQLNVMESYICTKDMVLFAKYVADTIRLTKINSSVQDSSDSQIYSLNGSGYFVSEDDIFLSYGAELVIRAIKTTYSGTENQLFSVEGAYVDQCEIAVINNRFAIETGRADGSVMSTTSDIQCQTNKWYYYKIVRISDAEIQYYYADATTISENPDFISICTNKQDRTISGKLVFGVDASTGQSGTAARQWYWHGKIDFDNSYMIINDKRVMFKVIDQSVSSS